MKENNKNNYNREVGGLVKLNVGGTVFQTTESTLTRFDGFFRNLLETDIHVAEDASGCIFIDRDPKHFRLILNFMRDGDVDIPFSDRQEIKKEAQFYLLDDLMKLCDDAKPVEKQINHRFFKSISEVTTAVENSTKQGVILIWYQEDERNYTVFNNVRVIIDYGEKFEVFFVEYDMNCVAINQNIHVFNKETKRSGMCTISRLRETIATLFPNRT